MTGSVTVATDNSEIFVNTRTEITKLFDRGDHAELAWVAKLDMYNPGRFQKNFKALGAEITANGIAFTGAVGVANPKQKFPFKIGAGLLDRETGEIRYYAEGGEDSISSMVTGPGGELYIGNSPMRRVLAGVTFGSSRSPGQPVGGISKFKPIYNDLLVRDALWAAATRASNSARIAEENHLAATQDVQQINALLAQALGAGPAAVAEKRMSGEEWENLRSGIQVVLQDLRPTGRDLAQVGNVLAEMAVALDARAQ